MARMQRSLFAQLNALAEEISQSSVKAAAEKKAGPVPADPGGYQGASSHPSANVGNDVQSAPEGARASEYESDIKKQQGALAVDNTPEMSQEGRQDDVQLNIGTNSKSTGEDPAAEKDYKGTKDDPGTSHPAKTNDGEKYSSVSFKEARDACSNLGNDILANLINFGTANLKQAEMPAQLAEALGKKEEAPAEEKAEHAEESDDDDDDDDSHCDDKAAASQLIGDQHKLDVNNNGKIEGSDLAALRSGKKKEKKDEKEAAFKAGYELAKALGVEKTAAEAAVREVCANTLREADEMADLLIGFMTAKQANADVMDEAAAGEDHGAPADAASGASDAPAAPAGLEGMMGGAGEDPMAAEGAPSDDEAVQELAMALEELGIPPEALLQAVAEGGAGGADPAAAMAAEEPKMAAANDLKSIGQAVVNFKRAGKFQVKEARTKRSRQLRDIMKQHVLELVNR